MGVLNNIQKSIKVCPVERSAGNYQDAVQDVFTADTLR